MARTIDPDRKHLTAVLRAAVTHEGRLARRDLPELPGLHRRRFAALTEKDVKDANQIRLEAGKPIRFGVEGERGVARAADGGLAIVDLADAGEEALIVHDPRRADPGLVFLLARLAEDLTGPTPIGIFRDIERAVFGRTDPAVAAAASDEALTELRLGGDTWSAARAGSPVTTAGAAYIPSVGSPRTS